MWPILKGKDNQQRPTCLRGPKMLADEDFKRTILNEVKKNKFAVNKRPGKKRNYTKETNGNSRVEIQYLK